jgi:2-methylcitrate dehydratase PrpD
VAGVLDKFIQIIEENNLQPEDIQSITQQPHPVCQFPFETENKLITEEDYCFHGGYLLACAAHRINPSRWHDQDVKQDPRIKNFMENVDLRLVIDEKDFIMAKRENPNAYQTRIEVVAKGKTFKEKAMHPKGGWFSEEFRNTDDELIKKFTDNATKSMSLDKASKAAQSIFELEKLGNTTELLGLVAP